MVTVYSYYDAVLSKWIISGCICWTGDVQIDFKAMGIFELFQLC